MAANPDAPAAALELVSGDGELVARFTPHAGMVGCSLRHRGEELLGPGGIPILHPWANRLSAWSYEVAGRRVVLDRRSPLLRADENGLPIHGALHASPLWEASEDGPGALRAVLDYGARDELLAAFPFRHRLELSIRLQGRALVVTTTVAATGGAPVPLSFGFHPWFRLPGVPRSDWDLELPDRDELVLDDRRLPTGATVRRPRERAPLGERTFDDLFRPLAVPARFALAGGGRRIVVEVGSGYRYAQVFAPPDADLVCFEPMTAPVDALATGSDLRFVAPFSRAGATFSVRVDDC